jgi:hypothetical protein
LFFGGGTTDLLSFYSSLIYSCLAILKGPSYERHHLAHMFMLQGDIYSQSLHAAGAILFATCLPKSEQEGQSDALAE